MTEECNKPIVLRPVLVESYRMAVAIEGATIVSRIASAHIITGRDIGCEDSVHVILVLGFFNLIDKRGPVGGITDEERR